jgi:hypothetical protein
MTARASLPPAPVGQQAPHGGAPRRARVPPIDYGDGLASQLTPKGNTEIRKCIQRRPHTPPRHTDRDRSEWVIGIAWNG